MKAFVFFRETNSGEGWWNQVGAVILAENLEAAKRIFSESCRKTEKHCHCELYPPDEYQVFEKELKEGLLAAFDIGCATSESCINNLYPGVKLEDEDAC
ncbi:MAG: hypothetical protein G01um101419_251 [Parcubacteria group bacterium Gr01-1014_19]|nr:MAG: hypothetical protein G01um101419_251 [Parcubacteria group bacterium Gr01-1014_19]